MTATAASGGAGVRGGPGRGIGLVAAAAAALAYALIVLGALVRATNSGLSCPDWPTCYGEWVLTPADFAAIPGTGYAYWQVMLEWAHRFVAGVMLGPLALALAVLAWRRRARDPALPRAAAALLGLLLVQGLLGGVTVLDRNSPWSVALHLGNALLVLTALLWFVVRAFPPAVPAGIRATRPAGALPLAAGAWALALSAMATAAVTAKSGASLACATWPLCDGALVPPLVDPLVRVHFAHRALAAGVGVALLALFVAVGRSPGAPRLRRLAGAALGLVTAQIGLGAAVVLLGVPVGTAVLHQAVGVLVFGTVAALVWSAAALPAPAARGAAGRGARTAGATGGADGLALQRG